MAETTDEATAIPTSESWDAWRGRLAAARRRRDDKIPTWQENVNKRAASPETASTTTRISSVNKDWPKTKAKIAQLYSQTPEVRLTIRRGFEQFQPALSAFAQEINDTVKAISLGSTIEEVLCDVVNASGIGGTLVTCEKRTEARQVPEIDPATLPPDVQQAVLTGAFQIPMVTVDALTDIQYLGDRISPADLLVPSDFTRSDYNLARWLAHDGRMTWVQSQRELGLTDDQKDEVLGRDRRASGTINTLNTDSQKFRDTEVVNYTQLFYWRHYYHADETNFKAIQRLVFVEGLEEPVVNEPYQAQRLEHGVMAGVTRLPIQVLTLTYVSDDCLPPSDSSITRHSVDDLEESRADMRLQRKHSIPIRWYNPNLVSPGAKAKLDEGNIQGFIAIANGERGIGEVARASFPPEKFEFDKISNAEISESWQVGDNQAGNFASGERSAREAGIIERNFQRRVGQEQDKVNKFFLGQVEVLAGHLAIYGTFDLPDELGESRALLANAFTYSTRVDATVRLDAEQRIDQLDRYTNKWAQSGYINPKSIAEEWATLIALDPARIVVDPQPKPPEPVKVSVSSALDLRDPLIFAALLATGQAPSPEHVAAAIKAIQAVTAMLPPVVESTGETAGAVPAEVATPGIRNPEWQEQPRINKRDEDGGQ